MPCTAPLTAYQPAAGGQPTFKANHNTHRQILIPCGQCMDCRLERARQWAVRIMHETAFHDENYFVTLTYTDEKRPRSLDHDHFQRFMKRLRKQQEPRLIRYFMCAEYGDLSGHAHFHAIIFGLHLPDMELYSEAGGNRLYTSKTLSAVWTDGYSTIGNVTMESAQYCASYCTKKVTGKDAQEYYTRVDTETGEIYEIEPEYAEMSVRPGIGKAWIDKYENDVYNYDYVVINGKEQKPPRYYDTQIEMKDKIRYDKIKQKRKEAMKDRDIKTTAKNRQDRDTNTRARSNLKQRTL